MGRPQPTTAELKRLLVAELELVRAELAHESRLARVEWNPVAIVRRSVQKHRLAWIIGGVFSGYVILRMLLPPKFRSDNFAGSDTKRREHGLFRRLVMTFAWPAAMNYASSYFKDYLQTYLESFLNRHGPVPDPDSSSHVASR